MQLKSVRVDGNDADVGHYSFDQWDFQSPSLLIFSGLRPRLWASVLKIIIIIIIILIITRNIDNGIAEMVKPTCRQSANNFPHSLLRSAFHPFCK